MHPRDHAFDCEGGKGGVIDVELAARDPLLQHQRQPSIKVALGRIQSRQAVGTDVDLGQAVVLHHLLALGAE